MTDDEPIALDHVSRSFAGEAVLRDVTLRIRSGETVALIGESGCGKSVTLKLMMALLNPTSGEVLWNGRPVRELDEAELRRQRLRLGYLFQGAALFDSLSVYENVAFGLRENAELSEQQIGEIVQQRIAEVGLNASVCPKKPAELSGGMRKRVGLARALALQPDVMFYDEPTTGLDPVMSDVINELILQTRRQRRITSVVVTHDMRTVAKVADRVVMLYPLAHLQDGEPQIIFEGSPPEAFDANDPRVKQFVHGEAGERTKPRVQPLTPRPLSHSERSVG